MIKFSMRWPLAAAAGAVLALGAAGAIAQQQVAATDPAGKMVEELLVYRDAGCVAAVVELKAQSVQDFMKGAEALAGQRASLRA